VQLKEGTNFYYVNSWDALQRIWKQEGINGFYKGLLPSMWGALHVAIQFPLYEKFKRTLPELLRPCRHPSHTEPFMLGVLIASIIAKLVASTITYPHEVIRTRLQTHLSLQGDPSFKNNMTIRSMISLIYHENNGSLKGFYRGLSTNLIRVLPASAITFLTYESILHYLSNR
jgi:solute carrier family 25 (mitochondrial folate transporter), member 32